MNWCIFSNPFIHINFGEQPMVDYVLFTGKHRCGKNFKKWIYVWLCSVCWKKIIVSGHEEGWSYFHMRYHSFVKNGGRNFAWINHSLMEDFPLLTEPISTLVFIFKDHYHIPRYISWRTVYTFINYNTLPKAWWNMSDILQTTLANEISWKKSQVFWLK